MNVFEIVSLVLVLKLILVSGDSLSYDESLKIYQKNGEEYDDTEEVSAIRYIEELDFSLSRDAEGSHTILSEENWDRADPTSLYNPYINEFSLDEDIIECEEDYCRNGLYEKKSKKLYNKYMFGVIKEYILNSKVHSWFYRIWSGSTVVSSPVLYLQKSTEFKQVYKVVRTNYKKVKDSSVIVILKAYTKELSKKGKENNYDSSISSYESSGVDNSEFSEGTVGEKMEQGEKETPVKVAISSLCIKLMGLARNKNRDNGKSYLFVIDVFEIVNRKLFVELMVNIMNTPCWNRSNANKSRIVIPIIIGNFRKVRRSSKGGEYGIMSDIYRPMKEKIKTKTERYGVSAAKEKRRKKDSRSDEDDSLADSYKSERTTRVSAQFDHLKDQLFIKWLRICNESKAVHERYEKYRKNLFKKLLMQYLVYAISNHVIQENLMNQKDHVLINYPMNCQESWDSLILLLEPEYIDEVGEAREDHILRRNVAINSVIDALSVANNSMFKEKELEEENQEETVKRGDLEVDIRDKPGSKAEIVLDSRSELLEELETCELLNILSSRDHQPVELRKARILEDLLLRLIDLPDQRKHRIEFIKLLNNLLNTSKDIKYLSDDIFQLFEAVDHTQNSMHIIRVLYISSIELGLTLNPLELLVNVCRNAKLIPYSQAEVNYTKDTKESQENEEVTTNEYGNEEYENSNFDSKRINGNEDSEDECNPFLYISQEILSDDYNGDLMEPIQKSSLKYVLLLLKLSQFNLDMLNVHVSNLVIKTERLVLNNIFEMNKVPSMVLVLNEKVKTMPFNVLSSFSYIKELKETRISSLLNPIVPIFHSYTLINLFGGTTLPSNNYEISKIVLMEICLMYFNPSLFLERVFVNLCKMTWDYKQKQEYHKQIELSTKRCDKIMSNEKSIGQNSHTVFLICKYLENIRNNFTVSKIKTQSWVEEEYISSEFNNRCDNIKAYCIQQSNELFEKISGLKSQK